MTDMSSIVELERVARDAANEAERAAQVAVAASRRAAAAAAGVSSRVQAVGVDQQDEGVADPVPQPDPAVFLEHLQREVVAACRFWKLLLGQDHLAFRILVKHGAAMLTASKERDETVLVNTALAYLAQSNVCIRVGLDVAHADGEHLDTAPVDDHLADVARLLVHAADPAYREEIAAALVARSDAHLAELDL